MHMCPGDYFSSCIGLVGFYGSVEEKASCTAVETHAYIPLQMFFESTVVNIRFDLHVLQISPIRCLKSAIGYKCKDLKSTISSSNVMISHRIHVCGSCPYHSGGFTRPLLSEVLSVDGVTGWWWCE